MISFVLSGRITRNTEGRAKVRIGKDRSEEYLTALNEWKSTGHDELHLGMLENSQSHEAIISENSCMTSEVPAGRRKANIIMPNFKRPIHLPLIPGKLLDEIISGHLGKTHS